MAIGDWLGSLFGGTPTYTPQPGGTDTPPGTLAGLLDPRGIREQAAWSGLGALSAGLIAAGQRRPAASPSLFPQALGAFGPAYQGALQSGYQSAAAEQQFRQREAAERTRLEREQAWQTALQAATPAERTLMQQMGPDQWAQMQGNVQAALRRPTVVGADSSVIIPATSQVLATTPPRPLDPYMYTAPNGDVWEIPRARGGAAPPAAGQPPAPGGAPPGGAPSGQPAPPGGTRVPVGIRNNNWLAMSPGGPPPGSPPGTPPPVAQYETPEIGVAAASQNLDRLFPSGTVTPRQLVQTWAQGPNYDPARVAPGIRASVENYGTAVARAAGASNPDQPINLRDPATRQRVMLAMAHFETGGLPQGAEAVLARGIDLAAQPGTRFTPTMPRQAQAGGGAPAQPPTAAPPQADTAPPPGMPPGARRVFQAPQGDPLNLAGNAERAQLINQYRALLRTARTRPLTDDEALALDIFRGQLEAPVQEPGGGVRMPPQMPQYPAPAAPGAAAVPPAPGGGAAVPPTGGAPAPAPAPVSPRDRPPVAPGMIRRETPGGGYTDSPVAPVDVSAVRRFEVQSQSVLDAMNNFERLANSASNLTRFNSWVRNPFSSEAAAIEQAYSNLVVTLRSEAFLNTGVLQEPERVMLQQMMRDPATTRGALTSPEARTAQFDQIREMIRNGINAQRQSIAQPPLAPAPPPPAAPARVIQYDAQGNRVRQ